MTTQALVERKTFAIDGFRLTELTIDKVYVRGHFYSDKAPGLALLAVPIYYPLYRAGIRIDDRRRNLVAVIITFLIVGISSLLCLAAFHDALRIVGLSDRARLLMTAGLAFGTLFLPWSTTLNNHAFSGAWTFIGFYYLLKAKSGEKVNIRLAAAGAAMGLAAAADTTCTLFVGGFGLYVLASRVLRRGLFAYAIAALVLLLPGWIINYAISGSLRPMTTRAAFWHYPGSYWDHSPERLTGITRNSPRFTIKYAFLSFFGSQGFLLYNPLLFIALYELVRLIRFRGPLWREAMLVLALSCPFVGFFLLYSSNFGGSSYSVRWFVTLIPLIWFFAYPFFAAWTPAKRRIYATVWSLSAAIAAIGIFSQWPPTFILGKSGLLLNCHDIATGLLHHFRS